MKIFKNPLTLILVYGVLGVLTILFFDGTGDSGDSIYHYLYAKYAFTKPHLFFDHWAKPLYVLVFSPFAQFGFEGVKVLNLLFVVGTLYFTAKISNKWFQSPTYTAQLFLIFAPLYFVLTFSGLTEPLFAFLLTLGIYFYLSGKSYWGLVIISFLPFVRSEGLLFILFFVFFELLSKNWKAIIYLLTGTVVYSLAGYPVHNDILWVFTKIPYATSSSVYGSGDFFHFFEQLLYVVGIPFYIFIWLGVIVMTINVLKEKLIVKLYYIFVLGAGMFILAHSLFWFFGIFNSMGLNRVLICVLPLLAIIAAEGWYFIFEKIHQKNIFMGTLFTVVSVIAIVLFPFTSNKAALDFKHDLSLNKDQKLAAEVKGFLEDQDLKFDKLYAGHPYINMILNVNPFDGSQFEYMSLKSPKHMTKKDLIIWDNWFSVIEQEIPLEFLNENTSLERIFWIEKNNYKGRVIQYAVFKKVK